VQLVETFAEQAAVALEYARLQRELHRLAVLEDRERIAKELHDGAIQALFAVGMGLQGSALLAGDPELRGRLQDAVEELDRVIRDLRNYIFGLRPGILADRQLDQALQGLVEEFQQRSGVLAIAEVDPAAAAELTGRAADVVQLASEALSNVSRHAEAATCRVSLYPTPTAPSWRSTTTAAASTRPRPPAPARACATCANGPKAWEAGPRSTAAPARGQGSGSRSPAEQANHPLPGLPS
jgi:signal transduction histidine kinase